MRRGSMLFVGLLTGGLLLCSLIGAMAKEYGGAAERVVTTLSHDILLPYDIVDAPLRIKRLVSYEGLFLEDGSDTDVANVLAAVIENTGNSIVRSGRIEVEMQGDVYIFAFTMLPPQSSTLVLEQRGQPYVSSIINSCNAYYEVQAEENAADIDAAITGRRELTVMNLSKHFCDTITVFFKSYDAASNMYIGGITYSLSVDDLMSGESRILQPYHLVEGYSRIVWKEVGEIT